MTTQYIGTSLSGASHAGAKSIIHASKFVASANATLTEFKVQVNNNGNVKVAIYADNAGDIGSKAMGAKFLSAVSSGWNTIAISPGLEVTSGTNYWLCVNLDKDNIIGYDAEVGRGYRYKAADYATGRLPSDATGNTSLPGYAMALQGWGTTGWANIASVLGVASADMKAMNDVAIADIAKIDSADV